MITVIAKVAPQKIQDQKKYIGTFYSFFDTVKLLINWWLRKVKENNKIMISFFFGKTLISVLRV